MSTDGKLHWDAECDATRAGMERFLRALVCTGSHFTDSFTLAPVSKPCRVTVFFRVWITKGNEARFLEMAGIDELKPPPQAHVGMEPPMSDGRVAIKRPTGEDKP